MGDEQQPSSRAAPRVGCAAASLPVWIEALSSNVVCLKAGVSLRFVLGAKWGKRNNNRGRRRQALGLEIKGVKLLMLVVVAHVLRDAASAL